MSFVQRRSSSTPRIFDKEIMMICVKLSIIPQQHKHNNKISISKVQSWLVLMHRLIYDYDLSNLVANSSLSSKPIADFKSVNEERCKSEFISTRPLESGAIIILALISTDLAYA